MTAQPADNSDDEIDAAQFEVLLDAELRRQFAELYGDGTDHTDPRHATR